MQSLGALMAAGSRARTGGNRDGAGQPERQRAPFAHVVRYLRPRANFTGDVIRNWTASRSICWVLLVKAEAPYKRATVSVRPG